MISRKLILLFSVLIELENDKKILIFPINNSELEIIKDDIILDIIEYKFINNDIKLITENQTLLVPVNANEIYAAINHLLEKWIL